jgi:ParB-like nuclease domain
VNFYQRLRARRLTETLPPHPPRTFHVEQGLAFCVKLPVTLLEPICERISRVQGDKFDRLVASLKAHGLANPLITVSELPAQNLDDWREFRYRFLYTIQAPIKLVVGHNRYAAIQTLGWSHVPVVHCGPIPKEAKKLRWKKLKSLEEAQARFRDGVVGYGPYSLVMEQFTPPLKAMPPGY